MRPRSRTARAADRRGFLTGVALAGLTALAACTAPTDGADPAPTGTPRIGDQGTSGTGSPRGWTAEAPGTLEPTAPYESWPVVSRADDGALVLAYSRGEMHGRSAEREVVFARSADAGRTWEPVHRVAGTGEDVSVYALSTLADGTLLAIVRRLRTADHGVWDHHVLVSADSGRMWEGRGEGMDLPITPTLVEPVVETTDGTLLACWHAAPEEGGGELSHGFLRSADGGRTWDQEVLGRAAHLDDLPIEGRLLVLPDDRILALWRQQRRGAPVHQSVGDPDGRRWTDPEPTNITDAWVTPLAPVLSGGVLHVYWFDRDTMTFRVRRAPLTVVDHPRTWPVSEVYDAVDPDLSPWDSGYVHAVALDDDTHVTVAYRGGRGTARVTTRRWRRDGLPRPAQGIPLPVPGLRPPEG
ncbi:sialidase family protein [Brevibacterium litoralis]|uniref:sialidase family protein n=1 Tax=Brevibacterium litoralis TaxID=3138935 RepID=UPI0032F09160